MSQEGIPKTGKTEGSGVAYKLDGAKFPTLEELLEALYPLYADTMTEEEFRKYAEEHAERT